jgi:hypothetical protein
MTPGELNEIIYLNSILIVRLIVIYREAFGLEEIQPVGNDSQDGAASLEYRGKAAALPRYAGGRIYKRKQLSKVQYRDCFRLETFASRLVEEDPRCLRHAARIVTSAPGPARPQHMERVSAGGVDGYW